MNVHNSFVDFSDFFDVEMLRFFLKNSPHGLFGVAILPDDSAGRVEGRVCRANLIEMFVPVVQTEHNYNVLLYPLDKRFV